jgi:hypothetical protein
MFDERVNKYHKALVIGTGGGNDIVSTLIPAQHLHKYGIQTDIAGILSPAAVHKFNGEQEKVINLVDNNAERFILTGTDFTPISFIDNILMDVIRSENIPINKMYDFSIRYGTSKLVKNVNKLIADEGYDLVVATDVGGDILGRANKDRMLLSPLMDFTTLYLLNQLNVDALLPDFGLLTDGELRHDGVKEILTELREDNLMLYESEIFANDFEVEKFRNVFHKIKDVRAGHTNLMTLKTLDSKFNEEGEEVKDIITEYRFRSQIGKKKWHTPFEVILPSEYAGKTYLIDGKGLAKKRIATAFSYENSLEQYVKLKTMCPEWKTEMDLFNIWSGDNWTTANKNGQSLFLLVPSTNIPMLQRNEIMEYGIANFDSDYALLRTSDLKNYAPNIIKHNLSILIAGNFSIVSKLLNTDDISRKIANQIISYQY